jgi:hypothetical protein
MTQHMIREFSSKFLVLFVVTFISKTTFGQSTLTGQSKSIRVPIPAIPFLSITPDSRAGAMGDVGVATTPDANSTYWNPAKMAFIENTNGGSLSYTPWLRNLVNDMSISYLTGYHRLNKNSTIAATLNYFDLGYIQFTNASGVTTGDYYSKEFSFGAAYATKLSKNLSVGVSLRYINSNLTGNQVINGNATKPGTTASADLSVYHAPNTSSGKVLTWAWGANLSNLGGKINYGGGDNRYFIPTNLRIGTTANIKKTAFNRVSISLDMNKLMIPTPPERSTTAKDASGNFIVVRGKDKSKETGLGPIFGSFADAPDGFKEEFKEMTWSLGAEYAYKEQFMFRGGYFYESAAKGGRSYATAGIGAKFASKYSFDFAYLFQPQQSGNPNPLNNTLRFTLGFLIDKKVQIKDDELN